MSRDNRIDRFSTRRAVLWIGTIALAALLAAPAFAHPPGHANKHKRKHHRQMHHARIYAPPPARWAGPPRRIEHRHARQYRPYFVEAAWFGPHRHRHAIYEFPVAGPAGYARGRQAYCDGRLFIEQDYRRPRPRPRFRVSVAF